MSTTTELQARQATWVLAATDQGSFILNRNDVAEYNGTLYGVGHELLTHSRYNLPQAELIMRGIAAKQLRKEHVTALDIGANIGVFTVLMAKYLAGRGEVHAFEPQERVFYALCGNLLLNNCHNAFAHNRAVSAKLGEMDIPLPDYSQPASFGSLEIAKGSKNIDFGQALSDEKRRVQVTSVDKLGLRQIDFIKIDVEGMEYEVLEGATQTLYQKKPILFLEHAKSGAERLREKLTKVGYFVIEHGADFLAAHTDDIPLLGMV